MVPLRVCSTKTRIKTRSLFTLVQGVNALRVCSTKTRIKTVEELFIRFPPKDSESMFH